MARLMVVTLLLLLPALPAFGKARNDIYSVPCSQLWNAVTITLGNPGDYKLLDSDDFRMRASYTITGAQHVLTNSVALIQQDAGCQMKVNAPVAGYMILDESAFRKRVNKQLAKLQASKPAQPATTGR
jgi:hypothetical protein